MYKKVDNIYNTTIWARFAKALATYGTGFDKASRRGRPRKTSEEQQQYVYEPDVNEGDENIWLEE